MQFQVPQFLEIEDKIFGPFTFKQFVYLVGGGGICFVLFRLLGFWWGIIPMLAVAGLSLALAFYRPNNKPFIEMLESAIFYGFQSKLFIWQKNKDDKNAKMNKESMSEDLPGNVTPKLDGSKLRDLAWSLDVLDLKK